MCATAAPHVRVQCLPTNTLSTSPAHTHTGWTFAFFNSKAQEERKARIERVNEQVCFVLEGRGLHTPRQRVRSRNTPQHHFTAGVVSRTLLHTPTHPHVVARFLWPAAGVCVGHQVSLQCYGAPTQPKRGRQTRCARLPQGHSE